MLLRQERSRDKVREVVFVEPCFELIHILEKMAKIEVLSSRVRIVRKRRRVPRSRSGRHGSSVAVLRMERRSVIRVVRIATIRRWRSVAISVTTTRGERSTTFHSAEECVSSP